MNRKKFLRKSLLKNPILIVIKMEYIFTYMSIIVLNMALGIFFRMEIMELYSMIIRSFYNRKICCFIWRKLTIRMCRNSIV